MILLLSIVAATLVWWLDRAAAARIEGRDEREPVWLVGLAYLWGATGGIVLAVIGTVQPDDAATVD